MAWVAIWQDGRAQPLDRVARFGGSEDQPIDNLTLWLEITMPRRWSRPIRLWQGTADGGVEIYLMPTGALRVIHGVDVDLSTPDQFLAPSQTLNLRWVFCAAGRDDVVDAWNADTDARHRLRSGIGTVNTLSHVLPRAPGFLQSTHVAAIATHGVPASDLPGLETGALVETEDGPCPVEAIRPGMTVLGEDDEAHVVRWTDARDRLCLGRAAPVLLRAPYFGLGADLCVTPDTRLVRMGAEVEYLTGTDAVLVRAADLVTGPGARFDRRRPIRRFHHLMLDDPACLRVWRCRIETAFLSEVLACQDSGGTSARPDEKDCTTSLPLLDRASARSLAPLGVRAQGFIV